MNIKVELITGDVNEIEQLDFMLIGHKNPLRQQICIESGACFIEKESESWMYPHTYELLQAPAYKWKQVAAIKFRPNGKVNETQFSRISNPIGTALEESYVGSVGILPPTWRNPSYCALGVIHSLLIIGCAAKILPKTGLGQAAGYVAYNAANTQFKIISDTGTEYFEEVLKDDCLLLWSFIRRYCKKRKDDFLLADSYKQLRRCGVTFDVSKRRITS